MRYISLFLVVSLIIANGAVVAPAGIHPATKEDCRDILKKLEKGHQIPDNLLSAIAHVESKFHPWAVNAQGKSYYFKTKGQAIDQVKVLQKKKVKNIGVGCMQINLSAHKFKTLEQAFDPNANIAYGAKLLRSLYNQHGNWDVAIRYYHTSNPKYNHAYKARVYRVWGGIKVNKEEPRDKLKIGFGPGMGIGNRIS